MVFFEWLVSHLVIFYLILTAGLILFEKKLPNLIKPAVLFLVFLNFGKAVFLVVAQYLIWQKSDISRFLLPPYQPFSYFFNYVSYRFLLPFFFPLGVALAFYFLTKLFNRVFKERLFYPQEPLFIFYGIILVGHPLWILYIFLVIFLAILLYLFGLIFKKIKFGELFSLSPLWLILAFFILLFQQYLLKLPLINNLKF